MASSTATSTEHSSKTGSLKDALIQALSEGFQCKVRYVHTAPKRCDPLFSTPSGAEPEITRLASHFLTISINSNHEASSRENDAFVLGIEVLIYTTKRLTTIFVSKADSTGYLPNRKPSAAKTIITTFVQWLANSEQHNHPTRKLVISLFARSQSQYLFPGSVENTSKHILDDRQLIKWWLRVLDPIFPKQNDDECPDESETSRYKGYLTVPGYEGFSELRSFLPPQSGSSPAGRRWVAGNPLKELAETRVVPETAPTRCLLPRFPDDPKARFIRDLDDEAGLSEEAESTVSPKKNSGGRWTSIRDLDRFWEAMSFRQECSSGRVVGFIWLSIGPQSDSASNHLKQSGVESLVSNLSSDSVSQEETSIANGRSPKKKKRKPLSGPIIPRQPRLKGGSSSLTASDLSSMAAGETANGLVLSQDGYEKAMHSLLHLDFANIEVARKSTAKWVAEVSYVAGIRSDWASEVIGTAKLADASTNGDLQVKNVNDLGGMIRKKRKAEDQPVVEGATGAPTPADGTKDEQPAVNMLGVGMIRKKPKAAPT